MNHAGVGLVLGALMIGGTVLQSSCITFDGCEARGECPTGASQSASSSSSAASSSVASSSSSTSSGLGGGGAGGSSSSSAGGAGGAGGAPPPPPTTCNVLVHDLQGAAVADLPVAVNDATGAVVAMAKTAPDGKVAVSVPFGGVVTAFDAEGLISVATSAVAPPDQSTFFVVAARNPPAQPPPATPTTFHIVAQAAPAGTKDYIVTSSCSVMSFTPAQMALITQVGCSGAATETIVMIARDAGGKALGWAAVSKTMVPGQDAGYAYFTPTQANFATFDATISNIPAGAPVGTMEIAPVGVAGLQFQPALTTTPTPGATLSLQDLTPAAYVAGIQVNSTLFYAISNGGKRNSVLSSRRRYTAAAGADALDASTYAQVSLDALDTLNPAHFVAQWTVGQGSRGDSGNLLVEWSNPGSAYAAWQVAFPVNSPSSLRFPDVPLGLEAFAPSAMSTMSDWRAFYIDNEDVASYAEQLGVPPAATPGHGLVISQGGVSFL
jgi:hypothetical protein